MGGECSVEYTRNVPRLDLRAGSLIICRAEPYQPHISKDGQRVRGIKRTTTSGPTCQPQQAPYFGPTTCQPRTQANEGSCVERPAPGAREVGEHE